MAKRLTDTDKWERPWFRALDLKYKLLWCYVLDRCDIAGIWYVDLSLASFLIGFKYDREDAEKKLSKQIDIKGERWLIKDFISFQYGNLTETNKLHNNVIKHLNIFNDAPSMPHASPIDGVKDKDKDIPSSKDINKENNNYLVPEDLKENESEIKEWISYKRQKGQTYKTIGLNALWRRLRSIPPEKRKSSIENSMSNNWAGIYESNEIKRDDENFESELKKIKEGKKNADRIISEFINK